jgi:hypothetical protein
MELEKQVVDFKLSEKLEELGVRQDSLFYWGQEAGRDDARTKLCCIFSRWDEENCHPICSAFTVAELVDMLKLLGVDEKTDLHNCVANFLAEKLIANYEKNKI